MHRAYLLLVLEGGSAVLSLLLLSKTLRQMRKISPAPSLRGELDMELEQGVPENRKCLPITEAPPEEWSSV